jgi:hypothetical protein
VSGRRVRSLIRYFAKTRNRLPSREPRYAGWEYLEANEVRRLKKAYREAVRRGILKYQHPRNVKKAALEVKP